MLRRVLHDRRIRFLVLCVLVLMAGMLIMIYMIPHYLAPFTAAFYAIGLQCMRHLRVWKPEGRPAGRALVRLSVLLCFVLAGLRLFAAPLHFTIPEWPASNWSGMWYGPDRYGAGRAHIENELEHLPGKQLVLVRPSLKRNVLDQWVYNHAGIDDEKVVWAAEMDAANNQQLLRYYRDRKAWLVNMDTEPATLTPYPAAGLQQP
jgi:hypothetical protein